jgi:hypothetical protein
LIPFIWVIKVVPDFQIWCHLLLIMVLYLLLHASIFQN